MLRLILRMLYIVEAHINQTQCYPAQYVSTISNSRRKVSVRELFSTDTQAAAPEWAHFIILPGLVANNKSTIIYGKKKKLYSLATQGNINLGLKSWRKTGSLSPRNSNGSRQLWRRLYARTRLLDRAKILLPAHTASELTPITRHSTSRWRCNTIRRSQTQRWSRVRSEYARYSIAYSQFTRPLVHEIPTSIKNARVYWNTFYRGPIRSRAALSRANRTRSRSRFYFRENWSC